MALDQLKHNEIRHFLKKLQKIEKFYHYFFDKETNFEENIIRTYGQITTSLTSRGIAGGLFYEYGVCTFVLIYSILISLPIARKAQIEGGFNDFSDEVLTWCSSLILKNENFPIPEGIGTPEIFVRQQISKAHSELSQNKSFLACFKKEAEKAVTSLTSD